MIVFLEVTPRWPLSSTPLLVCSAADRRAQTWDGKRWAAALHDAGTLSVSLFSGEIGSAVDSGSSAVVIAETPLLEIAPDATTVRWQDASVRMWAGEFITVPGDDAYPYPNTVTQVFAGKVSRFEKDGGAIKLSLDSRGEAGDAKVLIREYAGTGGVEGGLDLKGRLKPWVFGIARNVEPVLIDTDNSVYQFSGYGPIAAVDALYERGASFGASIGDYATYAALVAATIPAGRWATCLAEGLIRLGAPQFGVITGDVQGDYAGSTLRRRVGAILQRIADDRSIDPATIDTTSLAALDAFAATLPAGGYINLVLSEQTSFLDLARRLCAPFNAQAGYSLLGKLFACRVLVGTPGFTLDALGRRLPVVGAFMEADTPPPFKRIVMAAETCWRVHDLSTEVAFYADFVPRGDYDPAETYREGNIVALPDGSTWLYINPAPSAGNYPPTNPAFWEIQTPAGIVTGNSPTPPEGAAEGSIWFDPADGQHGYRQDGLALTDDGAPVTDDGEPVTGSGWVSVRDGEASRAGEMADAAFEDLQKLGEDGLLTVAEKIQVLIPRSASLEAAYGALVAAAATVGVSSSAATAARAEWLAWRNGITPAWNNTAAETSVDRDVYRTKLNDYDAALEELNRAIAEAASIQLTLSPNVVTIRATADGAPYDGELPLTFVPALMSGTTNRNAGEAWTMELSPTLTGTQDTTSNSITEGAITITGATSDGSVTVMAAGKTATARLVVQKDGAPPPTEAPGGGVTLSTSTTYGSVASDTFPADPPDIKTIRSAASGDVQFSASWEYGGNNRILIGKLVYRVAGSAGAWNDVAAATTGSASGRTYEEYGEAFEVWNGVWAQSITVTLTASTDYEWGTMFRRPVDRTFVVTPFGMSQAKQP